MKTTGNSSKENINELSKRLENLKKDLNTINEKFKDIDKDPKKK
ncbi:hypothetical protein [Chondrinema litorale]|nr:hypothetical protein [Chondrinema litorale]UZR99678.1 hypothetical protein OQ292_37950 [Chondrinema litorale]